MHDKVNAVVLDTSTGRAALGLKARSGLILSTFTDSRTKTRA